MALEAPVFPEDLLQQGGAGAAGLAVGAVVGTHHRLHLGFGHQGPEGGQVRFIEVFLAAAGIETVAQALRSAVHREVLGTGSRL